MKKLHDLRAEVEATPDGPLKAVRLRQLSRLGRKLAKESRGKLGWCAHHWDLHPADHFYPDRSLKRATGLKPYCKLATDERAEGVPPRYEKPSERVTVPRAPAPIERTRKCEVKSCGERFPQPAKSKERRCPRCRAAVRRRRKKA